MTQFRIVDDLEVGCIQPQGGRDGYDESGIRWGGFISGGKSDTLVV